MTVKVTMPNGLVLINRFEGGEEPVMLIEDTKAGDNVYICRISGISLINKTCDGLAIRSVEIIQ